MEKYLCGARANKNCLPTLFPAANIRFTVKGGDPYDNTL